MRQKVLALSRRDIWVEPPAKPGDRFPHKRVETALCVVGIRGGTSGKDEDIGIGGGKACGYNVPALEETNGIEISIEISKAERKRDRQQCVRRDHSKEPEATK